MATATTTTPKTAPKTTPKTTPKGATKTTPKVEDKPARGGKEVKYKGKTYASVAALAKAFKIEPAGKIRRQLRAGVALNEAMKKLLDADKEK